MRTDTSQKGFIALISVLIVSAVLVVTVVSLAQFGVASRFFLLDLENKTASKYLASACVHIARVLAFNDPAYTIDATDVTENINGETCVIDRLKRNGGDPSRSTIETCGRRRNAVTNYRVTVDNTDGEFVSWEEIDALSACP